MTRSCELRRTRGRPAASRNHRRACTTPTRWIAARRRATDDAAPSSASTDSRSATAATRASAQRSNTAVTNHCNVPTVTLADRDRHRWRGEPPPSRIAATSRGWPEAVGRRLQSPGTPDLPVGIAANPRLVDAERLERQRARKTAPHGGLKDAHVVGYDDIVLEKVEAEQYACRWR